MKDYLLTLTTKDYKYLLNLTKQRLDLLKVENQTRPDDDIVDAEIASVSSLIACLAQAV
jgi:hypothetical protein